MTRLTGGRAGGQAGRTLRDARAGGRAEVFGSSTALEKEYLRLTALPTLGAVRPPAVLEQVRRALELHRALYVCKHGRLLADCGAAPAHALPADGRDPHSLAAVSSCRGGRNCPCSRLCTNMQQTSMYIRMCAVQQHGNRRSQATSGASLQATLGAGCHWRAAQINTAG